MEPGKRPNNPSFPAFFVCSSCWSLSTSGVPCAKTTPFDPQVEVILYSPMESYTSVDFQDVVAAGKREAIWEELSPWEGDGYLCPSLGTRKQNHGGMGSRPRLSQQRVSGQKLGLRSPDLKTEFSPENLGTLRQWSPYTPQSLPCVLPLCGSPVISTASWVL